MFNGAETVLISAAYAGCTDATWDFSKPSLQHRLAPCCDSLQKLTASSGRNDECEH